MRRVLIVGGAGVFGRRLAIGLRETTSAHLILAGRSLARAQEAARDTRAAEAVALDRHTATAEDIAKIGADLIIDAAGPFQGANLRFARAVIEARTHYLDLADARDFVATFPKLDALACECGVAAITGASSTPALTHAVIDHLCAGWTRIDTIHAGIAPANQMDRGPAVMKAILSWTGAPAPVFEDGAWRQRSGWSDCGVFDLPGLGRRRFAIAETPDLDLLPARYAPRDTALFMAGLELPLMQRGMEIIGVLRRWGLIRDLAPLAEPLRRAGDLMLPFGSDRGGMIVEISGRDQHDHAKHVRWTMVAENGLGPYTPTFAALALARCFVKGGSLPIGARPCVDMLTLDDFAPEFARHKFRTRIDEIPLHSPFEVALGAAFADAPASVRTAHTAGPVTRFSGVAEVKGASTPMAAMFARLFGMPGTTSSIPVYVTMRLGPHKEVWTRRFGARRMESRLRTVRPGVVSESFGPFTFNMNVRAEGRALTMTIIGWRLGPIPLPAWLAPRSTATETEDEQGRFRFDVPIALPLIGRLTHYSGWLALEEVEAPSPASLREDA